MIEYAKISEVHLGSVLIADGGFISSDEHYNGPRDSEGFFHCLDEGEEVTVQFDKEMNELFVPCKCGQHFLSGQIEDDHYVGFFMKKD